MTEYQLGIFWTAVALLLELTGYLILVFCPNELAIWAVGLGIIVEVVGLMDIMRDKIHPIVKLLALFVSIVWVCFVFVSFCNMAGPYIVR